ncbi:MAG TPA: hypothetical protein VE623_17305 [Acidimicrobiales bacterium]|nr:hypothetical protein [Acidimicrobiales bacterium]
MSRRLGTVMTAVVQDTYGVADVLELREIERPEVDDHEVLVRVVAAGVDRGAWHLMNCVPYLMRIIGSGLRAPKVPVPGSSFAVDRGVTMSASADAFVAISPSAPWSNH